MDFKSILFLFIVAAVTAHQQPDSSYTNPTSSVGSLTGSSLSSTSSAEPVTVTNDAMTVTSTIIEYETTSTRITRTIEVIRTNTEFLTRTSTVVLVSTALSVSVATSTIKITATFSTSTLLTKVVFQAVTSLRERLRISTAQTLTSVTSVTIISLSRSTRTVFFSSAFATTDTKTDEIVTTVTRTEVAFKPELSISINPTATFTSVDVTILYIEASTLTRTTIVYAFTTSIVVTQYSSTLPPVFTVRSTITLPRITTNTQFIWNISTNTVTGIFGTATVNVVSVPSFVTTEATLIGFPTP